MKPLVQICLAVGVLLFSACGCSDSNQTHEDSNSPNVKSLRILEPKIDIGLFKSTDAIANAVTVHNGTDRPYKLRDITLSCGCLSTDFVPTELIPGEGYTFSVKIFNAVLGEGTQHGEIATEPPLDEPLGFEVKYEVEPSTYLFPDTYLLGTVSIDDDKWPRLIEFQVEALDNEIELSEPIRMEPAVYTFPSGLSYEVVQCERIKPGDSVKIRVSLGSFTGGSFDDFFTLTIAGTSETRQFAIAVAGQVTTDPITSVLEQANSDPSMVGADVK